MTGDQQHGAEGDGLARTDEAVGQNAAQQGDQIDQRGVGAVDRPGAPIIKQEVLGQIKDQQTAHAVIGETLPHFGEEADNQPARVVSENLQKYGNPRGEGDDHPQKNDDVHAYPL